MDSLFRARGSLALLHLILLGAVCGCSRDADKPAANPAPAKTETPMAKPPQRGFQDYVKNPELFHEEIEEAEKRASQPLTPQEIADRVATIGKQKLDWAELQRMKRAGDKFVPPLLTALKEEKFQLQRYGEDGSALETALDLLEPFGLPETSLLKPALQHRDDYFRSKALYHLARCGNDDAIATLVEELKSPSERCRSWTLIGLGRLKNSPRGSKRFRTALFDATVPRLADKEFNVTQQAPRVLLALDFERAKTVLLSKEVFHADNKSLNDVLNAFKDENVAIPEPQLRALLAAIKSKAAKYPFDSAYGTGLILLAQSEGADARDLIDDARKWGNDTVKTGAAEALTITAGVKDAYRFVLELYQEKGAKGLTEPQRDYLALSYLDAEVCNGGFAQFYFNSSGEFAPFAVPAAQCVGATELAKIIQEANSLFGKGGPSADRDQRMNQLSKLDSKALSALDSRYYKCPDKLQLLLSQFVADHAEHFKPRK